MRSEARENYARPARTKVNSCEYSAHTLVEARSNRRPVTREIFDSVRRFIKPLDAADSADSATRRDLAASPGAGEG